jgi:hypothetical protein
VGKFEENEIGSAGYLLSISSSDLSDEELVFAHKRGIFQKPTSRARSTSTALSDSNVAMDVAQFKNESFAGGGSPSTLKVYITSSNVTDKLWSKIEKEMNAGLADVENEDLWKFDVQPFIAERAEWLPIDYAIALGEGYKKDEAKFENKRTCWELVILVDEQTVDDEKKGKLSVNAIYQLTQVPERKDIMNSSF